MERFTLREFLDVLNPQEEDMDKPIYIVLLQNLYAQSEGGYQGVSPRQIRRDCAEEVVTIGIYRFFEEIGLAFGFESDTYWKEPPPEEDEDDDFLTEEDEEEAEEV